MNPGSNTEPTDLPHDRRCDLCGEKDFETLSNRDRLGAPLHTVVCRKCGLVSHATIPSAEELARYYESQYRPEYNREAAPSPKRIVREWAWAKARYEMLASFVRPGDKVFEIGAGLGCTLKHFELAGLDASGIEPGYSFSRFARDELRSPVERGFLEDVPDDFRADFVLLVHVLEHLRSPRESISRIRRLVRPGGRVFIEVPNLAGPHSAPHKLYHYAHIYNFTRSSLTTLAQACGFEVLRCFYGETCRNLGLLLKAVDEAKLVLDPDAYRKTKEAVCRYSPISYYARPAYQIGRLRDLVALGRLRWRAKRNCQQILDSCRKASPRRGSAAEAS